MFFERSDQSSNPTHFFKIASLLACGRAGPTSIGTMSEGIEHTPGGMPYGSDRPVIGKQEILNGDATLDPVLIWRLTTHCIILTGNEGFFGCRQRPGTESFFSGGNSSGIIGTPGHELLRGSHRSGGAAGGVALNPSVPDAGLHCLVIGDVASMEAAFSSSRFFAAPISNFCREKRLPAAPSVRLKKTGFCRLRFLTKRIVVLEIGRDLLLRPLEVVDRIEHGVRPIDR